MTTTAARILVVDDERDIRDNLRDILQESGFQVDTAEDGPSALALAERNSYCVALLDFRLPGMDGIEVWRRLKQRQSRTVAMLLTAYANHQVTTAAQDEGTRCVLAKPIDPTEVLRLIHAVDCTE